MSKVKDLRKLSVSVDEEFRVELEKQMKKNGFFDLPCVEFPPYAIEDEFGLARWVHFLNTRNQIVASYRNLIANTKSKQQLRDCCVKFIEELSAAFESKDVDKATAVKIESVVRKIEKKFC